MLKPFKLAVCMSGEIRTFDYCKESIIKYFAGTKPPHPYTHVEVDYFCHTWKDTERNFDPNSRHYRGESSVDMSKIYHMIDYLKPKRVLVDDKIDRIKNNQHGVFLDLFESFYRSVYLKRDYEIENGFEYDLVVKCRYDLSFSVVMDSSHVFEVPHLWWDDRMFHECMKRYPPEMNGIMTQDVYFFGSSRLMDRVSQLYNFQINNLKLNNKHDPKVYPITGPNVLMSEYYFNYHIPVINTILPTQYWSVKSHYTIMRSFAVWCDMTKNDDRLIADACASKVHYKNGPFYYYFVDAEYELKDCKNISWSTIDSLFILNFYNTTVGGLNYARHVAFIVDSEGKRQMYHQTPSHVFLCKTKEEAEILVNIAVS